MSDAKEKRDPTLDLIRATAILLVTLFHAWRKMGKPDAPAFGGAINWMEPVSHGPIGVAMFVFVSGYVLSAYSKPTGYGTFLFRRWQRLSGPYYIAILFWLASNAWGNALQPRSDRWDIWSHFLYLHTFDSNTYVTINSVFWYVGLIFQFYLIFPLLRRIMRKTAGMIGVLTASLVFTLWADLALANDWTHQADRIFLHSGLLTFFFPFVMGMIASREGVVDRFSFRSARLIPWIVGTGLIFTMFFWESRVFPLRGAQLLIGDLEIQVYETELHVRGILLSLWILGLQPVWVRMHRLVQPFAALGAISFSVYLYNYVMYLIPLRSADLKGMVWWSVLTIIFGAGAYLLVEAPYNRWLRLRKKPAAN